MASGSGDSKSTSSDTRNGKDEAVNASKPPKKFSRKRKIREKSDRKKKSWVWEHFTTETKPLMIKKEDGKEVQVGHTRRAKCKYCSIDFASDSTKNGTSTLQKHLEQHCEHYPGSVKNLGKGQGHFAVDVKGKDAVVTHWTQENCTKAAVEMIVIDEMPFSAIEKPGFKRFCKVAIPKWNVPCRKTVVKSFLSMYKEMKEDLRVELRDHCISLTTDTWTSIQNINYMVVTAHFIDNSWTMHKRVLNFCVIPNHQGLTIGKLLEKCLHDWSIKKLLTISVDNASSNKVALDYVKRKLINGDKQLVLCGKFLHVRCLAHVVNLIVKSGLRCMEKSVASIRNAVKYVRSSSARLEAFKDCVKKEELESKKVCVLDVPTRWNSTYIMLETALELRRAFDRLAEEDDSKFTGYFDEEEEEDEEDDLGFGIGSKGRKRVGPPVEDDWGRAVEFVKFLRVFFEATVNISATNKPTAHKAFFEIVTIKSEIDDIYNTPSTNESATEKIMFDMSIQMRSKYKKYFNEIDDMNHLLLVALVLDPRYKLKYFSFVLEKMLGYDIEIVKKKSEQLKDLVVTLTDLYASSHGTQSSNTRKDVAESGSGSSKRQLSGKRALMLEDWEKDLEDGNAVVVAHEVDRYLLDPIEKPSESSEFNILTWWRLMGPKYPNLQAVAKDVLAIQVSTVASESSFSTGKRVIDPHRSSLTPRSVEALICLQNWLKSDAITSLAYTPTPEEMEWFEKTEQEFEQEEKEQRENKEKRKENDVAEKKSKAAKASKGSNAGNASKN